MLEGVNVLNKIAEKGMPSWWWIPLVGIFILTSLIGSIVIIKEDAKDNYEKFIGSAATLLIVIYMLAIPQVLTGKYKYQVTIDSTVSFKEFDNNYKVIKKEGEIYTIIEK